MCPLAKEGLDVSLSYGLTTHRCLVPLGMYEGNGALVTQVMEDSPAEKAGIEAGDVILSFDGKELKKMRDLPKFVALTPKGKSVKFWRVPCSIPGAK